MSILIELIAAAFPDTSVCYLLSLNGVMLSDKNYLRREKKVVSKEGKNFSSLPLPQLHSYPNTCSRTESCKNQRGKERGCRCWGLSW